MVFLVDGFFTVAAFLVAVGAFLAAAADLFVPEDLSAGILVLAAAAFFAGTALVVSAFFVEGAFLDGGLVFCDRLNKTLRGVGRVIYLFGIGRRLRTLRSEFNFARWSLGENECLLLSSTSKCQVELMKIGSGCHIELVLLLGILIPYVNKRKHVTLAGLAFFIALRETPVRASSRCKVIASYGEISQRGAKGIIGVDIP